MHINNYRSAQNSMHIKNTENYNWRILIKVDVLISITDIDSSSMVFKLAVTTQREKM